MDKHTEEDVDDPVVNSWIDWLKTRKLCWTQLLNLDVEGREGRIREAPEPEAPEPGPQHSIQSLLSLMLDGFKKMDERMELIDSRLKEVEMKWQRNPHSDPPPPEADPHTAAAPAANPHSADPTAAATPPPAPPHTAAAAAAAPDPHPAAAPPPPPAPFHTAAAPTPADPPNVVDPPLDPTDDAHTDEGARSAASAAGPVRKQKYKESAPRGSAPKKRVKRNSKYRSSPYM